MDLAAELESAGFDVMEASHGAEAIALFALYANIDSAVVDIALPGKVTGYAVASALRKERPGCTVILASSRHIKMPDDFAEHVLVESKPYDPAKIALILRMRYVENL